MNRCSFFGKGMRMKRTGGGGVSAGKGVYLLSA